MQERLTSGLIGPATFKIFLVDMIDYIDRAPRRAALETLRRFGVPTGIPFSSYLRDLRVVVASTENKGVPLVPSADMAMDMAMAMELVRIRAA